MTSGWQFAGGAFKELNLIFNNRRLAISPGFTLLEVLIALAIFALCAAVLTAQSTSTLHNRQRLIEQQMALWVAKNRLAEIRTGTVISAEKQQSQQQQLGQSWNIHSITEATSKQQLKKITIRVSPQGADYSGDYQSAVLVSYIADRP